MKFHCPEYSFWQLYFCNHLLHKLCWCRGLYDLKLPDLPASSCRLWFCSGGFLMDFTTVINLFCKNWVAEKHCIGKPQNCNQLLFQVNNTYLLKLNHICSVSTICRSLWQQRFSCHATIYQPPSRRRPLQCTPYLSGSPCGSIPTGWASRRPLSYPGKACLLTSAQRCVLEGFAPWFPMRGNLRVHAHLLGWCTGSCPTVNNTSGGEESRQCSYETIVLANAVTEQFSWVNTEHKAWG